MRFPLPQGVRSYLVRRIAAYEETEAQADEQGKDAGPFRLGALFPTIKYWPLNESSDEGRKVGSAARRLLDEAASIYMAAGRRPTVAVSGTEGTFSSLVADGTPNDAAARFFYVARKMRGCLRRATARES